MAALIEGIKIDGTLIKDTLNGIGDLGKTVKTIITGKLDPKDEAAIEMAFAELQNKKDAAQTDINKIEAASSSIFVAGWRPYIGWVCGTALAVYYIPQSIAASILWVVQCCMVLKHAPDVTTVALPVYPLTYNIAEIVGLVFSMLGFGGIRAWEKSKGVAR